MANQRAERVAELMKAELSEIIRRELKDPRIGFVSITRVKISRDMRHAKIFLSVLGSPEEQQATLEGMESAKGFLRSELAGRIRIHHMPELQFVLDDSLEYAAKIERQLAQIREQLQGETSGGEQA
mgnify:CR=1 FL=1